MLELPHAFGAPTARGYIRRQASDFYVREELSFEPGDGGEHLWLYIRKTHWNTTDLALWLARAAKLPLRSVGYSGLKDRHAVTEQWFSLHLPGKEDPQWPQDMPEGIEIMQSVRHTRKLNRGTHRFNFFRICVTDIEPQEEDNFSSRLEKIQSRGVPNYFGEQRFGRDQNNWLRGSAWLRGEGDAPRKMQLKGIWLSAVRSGLFNAVLAERVRNDCWDVLLAGDVCQPEGSRGLFNESEEPLAAERVAQGEVNSTAPMPGVGGVFPSGKCLAMEEAILAPFHAEIAGLEREKVDGLRRSTRLQVRDLQWSHTENSLTLEFRLPAGAFATSVLAEIVHTSMSPSPVPTEQSSTLQE
ncbi:MAG: tRNA pseudouridine(13) synthase TruD [Alcanivoracaceae bacterium]|nr:tRNA pseudouridine(13) synthase TruD [Alcanivoracaceae bacterium]